MSLATTNASLPPGPAAPALVQSLRLLRAPYRLLDACAARYGDVFTLGLMGFGKFVMVSDPDLIRQIFVAAPDALAAGKARSMLEPIFGPRSIMVLDGADHGWQRRFLMPHFHRRNLAVAETASIEATRRAIRDWPRDTVFPVYPRLELVATDVITECFLGLAGHPEADAIKALMLDFLRAGHTVPVFHLPGLINRVNVGPWRRFRALRRRFDDVLHTEIRRRAAVGGGEAARGENARGKTVGVDTVGTKAAGGETVGGKAAGGEMVGAEVVGGETVLRQEAGSAGDLFDLLRSATTRSGEPIGPAEQRDIIISVVVAGHETVALALSWALELILSHPEAQARARAEIREVTDGEPLRREHLESLPYLDAAIAESMRLHPINPIIPRMVLSPIELGPYTLPPGVHVAANSYGAHHRTDHFPDPKAFRPDRFLNTKPHPFAWIPFGGGARKCIGMTFSQHEMKAILATILSECPLHRAPAPHRNVLLGDMAAPRDGVRCRIPLS